LSLHSGNSPRIGEGLWLLILRRCWQSSCVENSRHGVEEKHPTARRCTQNYSTENYDMNKHNMLLFFEKGGPSITVLLEKLLEARY